MNEIIAIIVVCQYLRGSTMSHSAKDVVLEMVIQLAGRSLELQKKSEEKNNDYIK